MIKDRKLLECADLIYQRTGLKFAEDKIKDLQDAVDRTVFKFNFRGIEDIIFHINHSLLTSKELSFLISQLTVNESYFFRHFRALEHYLLPKLVQANKTKSLRIWSAGCSTGEEPYTIAMVLHHLIKDIHNWNIMIIASDIDLEVLHTAKEGLYKTWSLRQISDFYKRNYFTPINENLFKIAGSIKMMVSFFHHNLKDDNYPSAINMTDNLDVVFCRNVTIYFDNPTTYEILGKFYRCLKDDAYLIVGHSEPSPFLFDKYSHEIVDDLVIYQKTKEKKNKNPKIVKKYEFKRAEKDEINKQLDNTEVEKLKERPLPSRVKLNENLSYTFEESKIEFAEAQKAFEEHRIDEALKILERLQTVEPDNVNSLYLLAIIFANKHQFDKAIPLCEKIIKVDSLFIKAYYLLTVMYKELKQYDLSIKNCKKALYIDKEFILAYYELIMIYMQMNLKADARKTYQHFLNSIKHYDDEQDVGIVDHLKIKNLKDLLKSFF